MSDTASLVHHEDGDGVMEGTDATEDILDFLNTDQETKRDFVSSWTLGLTPESAFQIYLENQG